MTRCTVCNTDYNDGELERHLIMYHITTNENIAKYIAYPEQRINTLEAAQPRRWNRRISGDSKFMYSVTYHIP
jgi:hypothetical protein